MFMGTSRAVRLALEPIVESFRPIAPMALLPLVILWFGTGTPAALPSVLLGSRLAMGVAWTAIIAAELAVGAKSGGGSSGGIGSMMFVFYAYSVDLNGIVVCMCRPFVARGQGAHQAMKVSVGRIPWAAFNSPSPWSKPSSATTSTWACGATR
jgi:ABC-type nitrate/sulfonate/bicarbonate transport system permease component